MNTIEKAMDKLGKPDGSPQTSEDTNQSPAAGQAADRSPDREAAGAPDRDYDSAGEAGGTVHLDFSRFPNATVIDPRSDHSSGLAEEFRHIKRPLLMNVQGRGATLVENPNLIMVTSSLAGEGKTFTTINLALSIATELDKTVLLADADVAKPDVGAMLGVRAEKGLIDVLLGDVRVPDVMLRTDIPNLTLLPAGRRHPHATELLASESMRLLAQELSTRYADRIVVFDSPPLLLTSEASVLAGLMGQIVLVIEESRTLQPVVKQALSMLDTSEIVGLVLNKKRARGTGDYYGGYGYYGYGR
ncbi:MAG: XrtA-associated tyrosine autokinase [Gammaproteobacteria bacterium]|jgi:protein-tyrosine kinase